MTDPAGVAVRPGAWREATVRGVEHPNDHAVVLRLAVPDRIPHLPGQHYVVRLTADDGYVAQRSYSIASAPGDPLLELYVERLEDGEVSGFLADVLQPGDTLDVRGPIGGWFVWDGATPALGIAGGSGAVPLIAMLRHARDLGTTSLLSLAVTARTRADLPFADELAGHGALIAVTRDPADRAAGRLGPDALRPLVGPAGQQVFVCGSAAFSGAVVSWLQELDVPNDRVRIESFGPSG